MSDGWLRTDLGSLGNPDRVVVDLGMLVFDEDEVEDPEDPEPPAAA